MNTAAISLKNISKAFPGYGKVLSDVDLEIRDGEFFVFVGPSGSGKSTLLRIMSGLEKQYQGSVERSEGDIGFVFQQFALLPWLTVYQNVALGFVARNIAQRAYHANVLAELKSFNLEKAANLYPRELSGGMRQRVGLARAFAQKPKVVFMDEPFSELDTYTAGELKKDLLDV
jgi:NitT/TauT family transport system ATP-binding protein